MRSVEQTHWALFHVTIIICRKKNFILSKADTYFKDQSFIIFSSLKFELSLFLFLFTFTQSIDASISKYDLIFVDSCFCLFHRIWIIFSWHKSFPNRIFAIKISVRTKRSTMGQWSVQLWKLVARKVFKAEWDVTVSSVFGFYYTKNVEINDYLEFCCSGHCEYLWLWIVVKS